MTSFLFGRCSRDMNFYFELKKPQTLLPALHYFCCCVFCLSWVWIWFILWRFKKKKNVVILMESRGSAVPLQCCVWHKNEAVILLLVVCKNITGRKKCFALCSPEYAESRWELLLAKDKPLTLAFQSKLHAQHLQTVAFNLRNLIFQSGKVKNLTHPMGTNFH